MVLQPPNDFGPGGIAQLVPKLLESKMDDIVVMQLLRSHVLANVKPQAVQEIDLAPRESRSVGAQIEDMFLPARKVDFESQLWLRIGQPLPRQAGDSRFFDDRCIGRRSQNDGRGLH